MILAPKNKIYEKAICIKEFEIPNTFKFIEGEWYQVYEDTILDDFYWVKDGKYVHPIYKKYLLTEAEIRDKKINELLNDK